MKNEKLKEELIKRIMAIFVEINKRPDLFKRCSLVGSNIILNLYIAIDIKATSWLDGKDCELITAFTIRLLHTKTGAEERIGIYEEDRIMQIYDFTLKNPQ